MKRSFIKKITALALSAMLTFSATTVYATTFEDDGYRSEYIDYDADYSKLDINTLFMIAPIGGKYTPESIERFSIASQYANEVYNNPNATQAEINTAYIEFCEAIERLEGCKLNERELYLCHQYCKMNYDNYRECFTEDSKNILAECISDAQLAMLYTNTQEGIDKLTYEITAKLRTLELTEENPDIVLWTELEQIDELMQEYISKNIFEGVDYRYNRIPIFKDFNGYRMVLYYNLVAGPMFNVQRYGDYIIEMNGFYHPSDLCYVLVNPTTGDIISLSQGLINGIVDPDKLFDAYLDSPFDFYMHIIGDANCDNQLSITDATYIQKICAGLEDDSNTYQASNFNDFNNDRKVNIIDATEIQKELVH